jgi:hypothetical protein
MSSAKTPFHGFSGGSPPPPSQEDGAAIPGIRPASETNPGGVDGMASPSTTAAMLKDTWAELKTTETEEGPPKETSLLGCTNDRRQKNLLGYVYVWCICVGGWGGVGNTWRARSNTSNFIAMLSTSACKNKKLSYINGGEGEKVL